jgi:hypothetical protein
VVPLARCSVPDPFFPQLEQQRHFFRIKRLVSGRFKIIRDIDIVEFAVLPLAKSVNTVQVTAGGGPAFGCSNLLLAELVRLKTYRDDDG